MVIQRQFDGKSGHQVDQKLSDEIVDDNFGTVLVMTAAKADWPELDRRPNTGV